MVKLDKIYTKTGDGGTTRLATGEPVPKHADRVEAYGTVDEANACLGLCVEAAGDQADLRAALIRIQNDLFDLGADIATPDRGEDLGYTPLRIVEGQVARLENEIDAMNADIPPLDSFVLPGGSALATRLHLARTVTRRAERLMVAVNASEDGAGLSGPALAYINRLSDWLFVASRAANENGANDVKWVPGANREV